jgi:hypothetical protein
MKGRRRKTLNAGEIEEFLSELNTNSENCNPNIVYSSNSNSSSDSKVTNCNNDSNDNGYNSNDSMETMIRKFCSYTYSPNNSHVHTSTSHYTCDIARSIHSTTGIIFCYHYYYYLLLS